MFRNAEESHQHSLQTLNQLYEYDDFMESITTLVDLGCGDGLDLQWWSTRTTRDDNPRPLNIQCVGVDIIDAVPTIKKHSNSVYHRANFEHNTVIPKRIRYDILWSHDSFQYCINPLETLKLWRTIANKDAMLVLIVPQTTNIENRQMSFYQLSGCFYHYSIVSLIHMLAITGWDCKSGFFKKNPTDNWLHAIVYKSAHEPLDPQTTTWYDLAEKKLLPLSAEQSIEKHGFLKQQDLVLPWIDKNLTWFGKQ